MARESAGQLIRAHRQSEGLTLRQLAEVSEVAHSTIYRLEQGKDCKASILATLAHALKLDERQSARLLLAARNTSPKETPTP